MPRIGLGDRYHRWVRNSDGLVIALNFVFAAAGIEAPRLDPSLFVWSLGSRSARLSEYERTGQKARTTRPTPDRSRQVIPVRLAAKQVTKIARLAELESVDRSTVLRMLIDTALDRGRVSLLMRRPGIKGQTAVQGVIRVATADRRVKVAQLALRRAPSVETEFNALRAEEEREEALAEYAHHHHLPQRSR
jgi:hypothetical protein